MHDKKYKSKIKILIAIAAIVLASVAVAAFLLLRPKIGDGYRTIVVAEVSGSVLVSNNKKQDIPAYEGMALFDGDSVTVSEDATLTIELDGDKYMMAEAGTKFRLEATGTAGSDKTVIHLEAGAALTRIENALNENQSYIVKTPTSVISVRGTVYRVAVWKNEAGKLVTKCDAFQGQVEVMPIDSNGNQTEEPQVLFADYSVSVMEIPAEENNGKQSAAFVRDEAGNALGNVHYDELPKNVIEKLIDCIEAGEELGTSKEELEEYLHEHTYADSWTYDDQEHWHSTICEHVPPERKDIEMHSFDGGVVTIPATHLAEGVITYSCKCGHTRTEAVAKLTEHTWSDWEMFDTESHIRSCECGESQSEAHDWNGGVVTIQPTHMEDGEMTFTCNICGHTRTEAVAKLTEHTWSDWETFDTESHIRSCECGESQSEAHDWNGGVVTIQPTHMEDGEMTFTCNICGHTRTETVSKLTEHTWSDWKTVDDETHIRSCECGESQSEAHDWNGGVVTIQPTHMEDGEMTFTCNICGHTRTEAVAKLTEHTWSDWKTVDTESHIRSCECGESQSEAHDWNGGVVTIQPTHMEDGEMTFTCNICGHTRTETVAKLTEHTWSDWETVDKEKHSRVCECGEMQQEAHRFGDGVEGTDPTGEEAMVYICSDCQYQNYEIIQSLKGQFEVDKVGYETWYEAAMALSNSDSQTVYLLRDLWGAADTSDNFSCIFGAVSLPYDNTDVSGSDISAFYEMTWDLNGCGLRLFGNEKEPPRIDAGAIWTIQATGGMLSTNGLGLNCPWYGGVLEGEIIILGGMFDFDPTEYVPAGYTVKMILAPDFYQGTDASAPTADYATILEQYGTYSALMNDRDKDEAELYRCRTPGLWIVYPDGAEPTACEHDCFTYRITVDEADRDYCSGCGAEVAHRHSVSWLKLPGTHSQECASCYETLVDWEEHTFDEGVAGVNAFGEQGTLYTCKVCDYRELRLTCTGEHVYGAGAKGADENGTPVMVYTCIYCDHQITKENLHDCQSDWQNFGNNDNYHWNLCTTESCPARIDYEVHLYESVTLTEPTHDQPGVTADRCGCGHTRPGSQSSIEFSAYFLDFSGCTAAGMSGYYNTIDAGDIFDYENIKLIGYYEDTTLEYDENSNVIGYDYGRMLASDEYTVHIYRLYSYDQKMLLLSLDLTASGEYAIEYVTSDGNHYTVSLAILSGAV